MIVGVVRQYQKTIRNIAGNRIDLLRIKSKSLLICVYFAAVS